jgi:3-deoxy-D-manno-octulosonic-acid transferase
MAMALYNLCGLLALAALVVLAPFVPRWRRGLGERLALAPVRWRGAGGELIWVHGASVGEVMAAAPLVEALLADRPAARILVSTTTVTGRKVAEDKFGPGHPRVRCTLLPFDGAGLPARVIRRERPALFILLETEIWPVLLTSLRRAGVPVLLANGRISPRSYGRYRALRRVLGPSLAAFDRALVRTPDDARRYEGLGVPPERIAVVGNLKHAPRDPGEGRERRAQLRIRLGVPAGRPVLVAGSLRGSESALVLTAFRRLRALVPELLLVLAPRHPDRFDLNALRDFEGAWVRWSAAPDRIPWETSVVLLDTVGELVDFYAAATAACVGGTWVHRGGHNVMEPAFFGVPVVFGLDFRHFEEEGRALLAAGAGFLAAGGEELYQHWRQLLQDRALREEAGARAAAVAAQFGGAVEKTVAAVRDLVGAPAP